MVEPLSLLLLLSSLLLLLLLEADEDEEEEDETDATRRSRRIEPSSQPRATCEPLCEAAAHQTAPPYEGDERCPHTNRERERGDERVNKPKAIRKTLSASNYHMRL